jgi:viroplasmin and RNaseH domain-containing protein
MKSQEIKYYAVARGIIPGIYRTWAKCKEQTHRYPGNKFKSFQSYFEALTYMRRFNPNYEECDVSNKIDRYFKKIEKNDTALVTNENTFVE